jgi:hypothetical protein
MEWAYRMLLPLVSQVQWADKELRMSRGIPVNLSREEMVRSVLEDPKATHILWVDSDSVCESPADPNTCLQTLLSLNEPIVSGLYRAKQKTGFNYAMWVETVDSEGKEGLTPILNWTGNWLQVDAIGLGFCLVKREVYERIPRPWFPWELGGRSEDFEFCRKAIKAGYKINVFTDVRISHIGLLKVKTDGSITTLDI